MVFIARDNPPEVLQPREQSLDFPPALVTAQASAVLRSRLFAIGFVRCDQPDSELFQLLVQRVRNIRFAADYLFAASAGRNRLHVV
jgi:hypothetical protein